MDVEEVTTGCDAAVVPATLNDLAWTVWERLDDDIAVIESAGVPVVNNTAFPPGSSCAQRCETSPSASVVNGSGLPPPSETRISEAPGPARGWNTIEPFSPHVAPRPLAASHNVTAAPPVIDIFFSFPPAKKPIHCPSGEKNGLRPSSVPDNAVACS